MKWTDSIRQTYIFFLNFFVPFFSISQPWHRYNYWVRRSQPTRSHFFPEPDACAYSSWQRTFSQDSTWSRHPVHQRGTRLSAIVLNMFEWQSPCFSVLLRICCFLDWEFAQMYSRYCGEYSSKRLAANFVALVCVAISARKSTLTALQMRLLECSR